VRRVRVDLGERGYDVVIGPAALAEAGPLVAGRRRVALVTQRDLVDPLTGPLVEAITAQGVDFGYVLVDDGEGAKRLSMVEFLCRSFAQSGLLRQDVVVAVGGGVVGDVAGFAAAVYHRGVDVVQVPTTLLAMVDSSIGGKTGVNLPEGKNLVGALHQPLAVLADVDTLATLPAPDYRAGLGEVAKYALIESAVAGASELADLLRLRTGDVLAREPDALAELVARCASIKATIVAADPHERTGVRATLNYGHTLAHALETVGGYSLSHGEAVGIGLVFAGELAGALERIGPDGVDRHRAVVASLGLPAAVPGGPRAGELLEVMRRDKKSRGGLTFVLPGARGLERVDDPPAPALEHAFRAVGVEG
jgi:5-deoxy-5-amino-3-dehydroquinate synthase